MQCGSVEWVCGSRLTRAPSVFAPLQVNFWVGHKKTLALRESASSTIADVKTKVGLGTAGVRLQLSVGKPLADGATVGACVAPQSTLSVCGALGGGGPRGSSSGSGS